MTTDKLPKRGNRTKRISNYWCGFCRKEVTKKDATKVPTSRRRHFFYNCPVCGGQLLGDAPGIRRDFYQG